MCDVTTLSYRQNILGSDSVGRTERMGNANYNDRVISKRKAFLATIRRYVTIECYCGTDHWFLSTSDAENEAITGSIEGSCEDMLV